MKFFVTIEQDENSVFQARCLNVPKCAAKGGTEQEALQKLDSAIRKSVKKRTDQGLPPTIAVREIEIDPAGIVTKKKGAAHSPRNSQNYQGPVRVFTDGCSKGNPGAAGIGFQIEAPGGDCIDYGCRAIGIATNNEAEYEALLMAMERCLQHGFKAAQFFTDSQLMACQVNGTYQVKNERMARLLERVNAHRRNFDSFKINYIPREQNRRADELSNEGLKTELRESFVNGSN